MSDDRAHPGPSAGSSEEAISSAELLARAGWLDLLDDLHGGLCHDVNSRVASVEALLHILELDGGTAGRTEVYLAPEAVRLAELARVLGHLSGRVDARAEAFEMAEILSVAALLHARHRTLGTLEAQVSPTPQVAPVRASRPRLLRVLLLLLAAAGSGAHAAGSKALRAEITGTEGWVELRVRWGAKGTGPRGPELLAGSAESLARLLALDDGGLLAEEDALGLRLPALGRVPEPRI